MSGQDAGGLFALLFMCTFILIPVVIGIGSLVLMIYALVHAATHKMENQAVWILVIILGGPIGSLVYFIAKPYNQTMGQAGRPPDAHRY